MYKDKDYDTIVKMGPEFTKWFTELADEVERSVPPSGKFQPLFVFFEDKTKSMDIVSWSLKVRDLIYDGCERELWSKRFLEVVGYVGGGYCITQMVGSGSVEECAEQLRSRSFVVKVMETMMELLDNWDD